MHAPKQALSTLPLKHAAFQTIVPLRASAILILAASPSPLLGPRLGALRPIPFGLGEVDDGCFEVLFTIKCVRFLSSLRVLQALWHGKSQDIQIATFGSWGEECCGDHGHQIPLCRACTCIVVQCIELTELEPSVLKHCDN